MNTDALKAAALVLRVMAVPFALALLQMWTEHNE